MPVRGNKKAAGGVAYLGDGGYGTDQHGAPKEQWHLKEAGFISSGGHVMVLSLSKNRID